MKNFKVSADFKARVTAILSSKKFTAVFPYMNLINREGDIYTESELNSLIQFMGTFAYAEVAEFFNLLPTLASEIAETNSETLKAQA